MRQGYLLVVFILLSFFCLSGLQAQTYDLNVVEERNDATMGGFFDVRVQIQSVGGTFVMGTSNLVFEYNAAALSNPTLQTAHNFSGVDYSTMTITEPNPGGVKVVSTNIGFFDPTKAGTVVASTFMDVVTIRFTIVTPALTSVIVWRTTTPNRTLVQTGNPPAEVSTGAFTGLDVLLPVELAAFTASVTDREVVLHWTTVSETNNFGFDIERSEKENEFRKIGFVEGNGTTTTAQKYSFVDENLVPGIYYYRLKQIDLDGAFEYSDAINVTVTPPKEFALAQNYPNPFNPTTTIRYDLPVSSHVVLTVYNILGKEVKTLVDVEQSAGIKTVVWDGTNKVGEPVSSGVYIYRLKARDFHKTLKLMMLK